MLVDSTVVQYSTGLYCSGLVETEKVHWYSNFSGKLQCSRVQTNRCNTVPTYSSLYSGKFVLYAENLFLAISNLVSGGSGRRYLFGGPQSKALFLVNCHPTVQSDRRLGLTVRKGRRSAVTVRAGSGRANLARRPAANGEDSAAIKGDFERFSGLGREVGRSMRTVDSYRYYIISEGSPELPPPD